MSSLATSSSQRERGASALLPREEKGANRTSGCCSMGDVFLGVKHSAVMGIRNCLASKAISVK